MQWISDSIQSLFGRSEAEAGDLQTTGVLTKEQLNRFFEAGHKMFEDPIVKLKLKEAAAKRQIFESQGIAGKFGVAFLARIRTVYADDAEIMRDLMQFVEREELALDEAELTIDDFLKKLELREWAVQQYQSMQLQMKDTSPQEQRNLLLQQQMMMKEVTKESKDIVKRAEGMNVEEKKKFIDEQVKHLQQRFQMTPSSAASHGPNCQHCSPGEASAPAPTEPNLGSVMSAEEQANFFKALYNAKR